MNPKIVYRQYGGKATLAKWIASHFPEHRIYCEPFCGSCAVLFAKPKSFIEIVNDIDETSINVFKKIREEPEKLASLLWATPYAKANWRDETSQDDLERARLAMAQSVQFFCGNGNNSTWSLEKSGAPHKPKSEVWSDWFLRVLPAAARLKDVQILNEDALTTIDRVRHLEDCLIYIDPPYFLHEKEYRHTVSYPEMVKLLKEVKGKVVVSEFETAASFYEGWERVSRDVAGRARTGTSTGVVGTTFKAKKNREVLFANFSLAKSLFSHK